jgi:lysophospholipase L1-like esterase
VPTSRVRSLVLRGLAVALSSLVALLLAEMLVRWIAPRAVLLVDRGLYLDDPPRGYRLNPGFVGRITNRVEYSTEVRVNAEGLRGAAVAPGRERPRVLVLGDSFAFGVGAGETETLPVRLAAHLAAETAPAEVLNGGVPGYGVPDEASWYTAWGRRLDADLVVLLVFVGNDLQDAVPGRRASVIDGLLVIPGASPSTLGFWLYHHSELYVLLKTSPAGDLARRLLGRPTPHERAQGAEEMSLYATGEPTETEQVGGAATARAVRELAAAMPPPRLVAVLVPSLVSIDPKLWRETLAAYGLDPSRHDPGRLAGWFRALFEREGIPTLDLAPALAAALARGERVYYPLDRHLTPAGYDLAALEVARFVAPRLPRAAARSGD